jgi:predicted Zn-dependent protease with MMP-like domain
MFRLQQNEFEKLIAQAMDNIPDKYYKELKNVVFVAEDEPNTAQRKKLRLRGNQSLYGLYEGIPITKRTSNYNLVLPDRITIFRFPILMSSNSLEDVANLVQQTVWHEVAHYFGLNHDQIHELER